MSYTQHLIDLLRPLRVYNMEGPYQLGELQALGEALDCVEGELEEIEREMNLATARSWGTERMAELFRRRPPAQTPHELAQSLAALMRIGADSFTPEAINDTIGGCGVNARVIEGTERGTVVVVFPNVPGIPDDFGEISAIIESILPAHLLIQYAFWYLIWRELEEKFQSWAAIEELGLSWEALEKQVY